ncbi:MAG: PilN domain-containing protein [Deltaproteobacteria bacterium]|nr:PilN domain-containing protein [Deltaproteobacteria bacterium]
MIRINLLPFRAAKRLENIRMQISVYVLSVILLVVVFGFSLMGLNREIGNLQAKNTHLKKELDTFSEMLKKMDELKKKRKDLQAKLDVIRGLEAQKAGPVQLFDEIAMAVPKGKLFLKALNESKDRVNMSGVARDYDTVAKFMTNLEKTHTIKTVTLGTTNQAEQTGQSISNFNLICTKESGEEKPKKVSGKKRRKRR